MCKSRKDIEAFTMIMILSYVLQRSVFCLSMISIINISLTSEWKKIWGWGGAADFNPTDQ